MSEQNTETKVTTISTGNISIYFPASDGKKYEFELSVRDTIWLCSALHDFLLLMLQNATPPVEVAGNVESKCVVDNLAGGQSERIDSTL